MPRESVRAAAWALVATVVLAALVVVGSRRLEHFDAALVPYTFATLFAVFGIAYRYVMWIQRPPTAVYFRRGWQVFLSPKRLPGNVAVLARRLVAAFALNDFIWRRGWRRGLAHWLIMWGCMIAAAVTFPLVFGWLHFETLPGDLEAYRIFVFGFPAFSFALGSVTALVIFHMLVWSALLVIPGVMLAMRRRMRDRDAAVLQRFGSDVLPLVALFAISITGLALSVSYEFMHGYAYEFLSIVHASTVILTLLWLPFGKFFHLFQRPAQLGVAFYKDAGREGEQALCRRCGEPYTSKMHVEDLIEVERRLGYRYELAGPGHYQWICPRCRRVLFGLAQGELMRRLSR